MNKNFSQIKSFKDIEELTNEPVRKLLNEQLSLMVENNGMDYRLLASKIPNKTDLEALDVVISECFNSDGGFFLVDIDTLRYSGNFKFMLKEPVYTAAIKANRPYLVDYDIGFTLSTSQLFDDNEVVPEFVSTRQWLFDEQYPPMMSLINIGNIVFAFVVNLNNQDFIEFVKDKQYSNFDIVQAMHEYLKANEIGSETDAIESGIITRYEF